MRSRFRLLLALVMFLTLAFVGLRVYGFYHNEKAGALHQADMALTEAKSYEELAQQEQMRSACSLAWLKYKNEQTEAEIIRLKQGEVAYLKAQSKLIGYKPLCEDCAISTDAALKISMDEMEHTMKAAALREQARALSSYALNRKQQTKELLHAIWISITGQKD